MPQLHLFPKPYFCHNCRQFVAHVQRTRRFRLCDECWQAIMPAWAQERDANTRAEREQIAAYWAWYEDMERLYPSPARGRGGHHAGRLAPPRLADSFWPYCECGQERREFSHVSGERSLFGGPRMRYCPVCEARRSVEAMMDMADAIHPDWDDETWMDALYQSMRSAFDVGVLPDYWFELRLRARQVTNE